MALNIWVLVYVIVVHAIILANYNASVRRDKVAIDG